MIKERQKIEFRYYNMPTGDYVLPLLGKGWEQEYGLGLGEMLHFHNYLEIGYCYHGEGRLLIEDREYKYHDNMFTVIPASIPHTTISKPGNICKWEFLFIDIDSFIKNEMKDGFLLQKDIIRIINKTGTLKSKQNHPVVASIIRSIIEECRHQSIYYKESLKGYLHALVIELLRIDEEREEARGNIKLSRYIESAVAYIEENYAEEIKVSDIAKICGLSESHFRRIFEESMNMKPMDYINLVRVDKACAIIKKEDVSMEAVGYRVGYITPSTFNRNFKKITGISPYQWRTKNEEEICKLRNYNISAKKGWEA